MLFAVEWQTRESFYVMKNIVVKRGLGGTRRKKRFEMKNLMIAIGIDLGWSLHMCCR